MPETSAQRRARQATESPAKREERRAKDRLRYRAKRKKQNQKLSSAVQILRRANADAKPPAPPSPIIGMVDAALAAPVSDVSTLAGRDVYAEAVDELTVRIGWRPAPGLPSPQATLWATADADVVKCHRLASGIMPESVVNGDHVRRDRAWLRSLDSESARVCLAILGELPDWSAASPRVRAGYLLGWIVAARRVQP